MNIEYKITDYFEKNNLFDSDIVNGLIIQKDANTLYIKGSSRDLIGLADLLTNLALEKHAGVHIHIDESSLLNKKSIFSEIVIEKE